jgi:phospholipid/cholesterol/gamma-HCH transport system permease protein
VEQIGVLLISFIVNEFSPIFTTLFFIFVYGLSIQEKTKLESLNDKNDILNLYNAKLVNCIFLVPLMSFLFATLMILSACVVSIFFLDFSLETYKNLIINSIALENIFILLIKSSVSSLLTMLVPIFYANKLRQFNKNINVASSLKIFIIMLIILLSIELASILIVY